MLALPAERGEPKDRKEPSPLYSPSGFWGRINTLTIQVHGFSSGMGRSTIEACVEGDDVEFGHR